MTLRKTVFAKTKKTPVLSGLLMYLDAGNTSSYSGSGTNWNDISGNSFNAVLNNGPVYSSSNGGILTFDGINDYAISGLNKSHLGSTFTISFWYRNLTNAQFAKGFLQLASALNSTNPFIMLQANPSSLRWYINGSYNLIQSYNNSSWNNIVLTFDGTTWRGYQNTLLEASYVSSIGAAPATNFYVANGFNGYINASIPIVMVYNRALSSNEIIQNYNAFNNRF